MNTRYDLAKQILEVYMRTIKADVAVFGSGPAGIGAAIAAARGGAKTYLIEKMGTLGGQMTCGLVTGLHGYRVHKDSNRKGSDKAYLAMDHQTKQVVGGIPVEIVEKLKARGGAYTSGEGPAMRQEFDAEIMKIVLFEMTTEAGVNLMLDTFAFGVIMDGKKIKAVRIANKNGEELIEAKQYIDATADGDISAWAGALFEIGRAKDNRCETVSVYMKVGNVNLHKMLDYLDEHPEENHIGTVDGWRKVLDSNNGPLHVNGFKNLIRKAHANGDYVAPIGALYETPSPIFIISHSCFPSDQTALDIDMGYNINASDADDLTKAETHARMVQVPQAVKFLQKYVPGFEKCYLIETASLFGTRESRRIIGDYVLCEEDILNNQKFDDGIARSGRAMNVHSVTGGKAEEERGGQTWIEPKDPQGYDIPYRCILVKGVENVLTSGRCISVTHTALGSVRGIPVCMATGEAAGTAAALAVKEDKSLRSLDIGLLREILRDNKVILD
jgi:hypothetical protein